MKTPASNFVDSDTLNIMFTWKDKKARTAITKLK